MHHRCNWGKIMISPTVLTFLNDNGTTLIGVDYFARKSEHITLETPLEVLCPHCVNGSPHSLEHEGKP